MIFETLPNTPLFPLRNVIERLSGYFMDKDFNVYSTRRSIQPQRLMGTVPSGGAGGLIKNGRTFTLNGVSYTHKSLKDKVLKSTPQTFKKETAPLKQDASTSTNPRPLDTSGDRDHASSVAQGLSEHGYVIGRVAVHDGEEILVLGSRPKIHLSVQSYQSEMERLAVTYPGVKFIAMQMIVGVVHGGLQWIR